MSGEESGIFVGQMPDDFYKEGLKKLISIAFDVGAKFPIEVRSVLGDGTKLCCKVTVAGNEYAAKHEDFGTIAEITFPIAMRAVDTEGNTVASLTQGEPQYFEARDPEQGKN